MKHNTYLEAKILTAPAHRLQLMLAEGAIRFGRQAEQAMQRGDFAAASPLLLRLIDIVGEMLVGVRHAKTELNRKLADLYLFLLRKVSEAKVNDDVEALTEALGLLEYERQTWQLLCDKLAAATPNAATDRTDPAGGSRPRALIAPPLYFKSQPSSPGISLEA